MKPFSKKILGGIAVGALVIQFIKPAGKNPPVTAGRDLLAGENPPPPNVSALLRGACYDCHSCETKRPWYGYVAPVSWWLDSHINDARSAMNFSEWPRDNPHRAAKKLSAISDEVGDGSMPLPSYTWMHPAARLTAAERKVLADWADAEEERIKSAASK